MSIFKGRITIVQNKDILTDVNIKKYLKHGEMFEIHCHNTVSSTNILLKDMAAAGAGEGTLVIAESQTNGRGRLGRSFHSPDGTGLYMSLLLRPDMETAGRITTMAAVAVCRGIESVMGYEPKIKWVNDILLDGKKVCGILAEASSGSEGIDFVVLGIGVNVYYPDSGFPQDIADIAGALTRSVQTDLRSKLAAKILDEFWAVYSKKENVASEYNRRCMVPGNRINVIKGGESTPAYALSLDDECRLVVRYDDGRTETLGSGEISVRLNSAP